MQQATPWRRPANLPCSRCGSAATHLVYVPELDAAGKLHDKEAAFAGALTARPLLACLPHSESLMPELISLAGPAGVAAAPLRATWKGYFFEQTLPGRLVWRVLMARWTRQARRMSAVASD